MTQDIFTFGKQLVETRDLDPVYVVVHQAIRTGDLDKEKLAKWLLAYWCFYHVGTASWAIEQPDYWGAMHRAAGSKDYPRSSERRHFRAKNAIDSVTFLQETGIPGLFDPFHKWKYGRDGVPLVEVMDYIQEWVGFGPWIAFKVADMLERLDIIDVTFKPEDVFRMFDAPKKGAEAMAEQLGYDSKHGRTATDVYLWAYNTLIDELGSLEAPPRYERTINIQEVETILCKWKSHLNGHYEVGKDIAEVRHGLLRFARCRTSQALLKAGGRGGLW